METCTGFTCVLHEDYLKWQFPHCLGAIDGKHIFIRPPPKSGSMYFNYKSRFSIILMAVVDANYNFVYASAGTQGRVEAMDRGMLNFTPVDTLPHKVVTIIFACLCLHNFLWCHQFVIEVRDKRPQVQVLPPGYVDSEDANHQLVEGAWRREGELQSVSMGRARNPSVEAKKQRDILRKYFVSPEGNVSWQEDMV
ncbi:cytoskeleton-associated protein 5 [Sarotherodon galilaeus]